MDNLTVCIESCLHPVKWHSGKFDLGIGCRKTVSKYKVDEVPLARKDEQSEGWLHLKQKPALLSNKL